MNTSSSWTPPRSPLPPHKLAKLANALGVSTPIPAHPPSPIPDHFRRSPTPSPQSTSKYLLHVIPPGYLSDASELTPPPSHAPGYHTQFRRGTLVPMHPTLQSQLGAIASEYALPSTIGIILYLVHSDPDPTRTEPGPRLSEDIWKHLWNRVMQAERSNIAGLGIAFISHSPSYSPPFPPTRPMETPQPQPRPYPLTPSSSNPSSISDLRSQTKSAPPSSSSSEPLTPDTSSASQTDQFDLPGLRTPSFVPILAKVEFDIDRQRAVWYEPWIRSRRINHAKRVNSRPGKKTTPNEGEQDQEQDPPREKNSLLDLQLVTPQTTGPLPNFSFSISRNPEQRTDSEPQAEGYGVLPDSPQPTDFENDQEPARVETIAEKDPLEEVFGTDADTWAEIHAQTKSQPEHPYPSEIAYLALTAEELTSSPELINLKDIDNQEEEEEAKDLLQVISRSSGVTPKKHIPPPLIIQPCLPNMIVSTSPMPPSSSSSAHPPDFGATLGDNDMLSVPSSDPLASPRYHAEEKRGGGVFDDFNLGLEALGEVDPEERHSQYLMKTRLDEIEKTLAQLSPQPFRTDAQTEAPPSGQHLPPPLPPLVATVLSPSQISPSPDVSPPHEMSNDPTISQPADQPAVSPSSLVVIDPEGIPRSHTATFPPSPSRSATKELANIPSTGPSPPPEPETGTQSQRRELEEQDTLYPPLLSPGPPPLPSPVIPLSPDPFNRHPSAMANSNAKQSAIPRNSQSMGPADTPIIDIAPHWRVSVQNGVREGQPQPETTSSRFSADSITGESTSSKNSNRTTLLSVGSIKKLWRKSTKSSVSSPQSTSHPDRTSVQLVSMHSSGSDRTSAQLVSPHTLLHLRSWIGLIPGYAATQSPDTGAVHHRSTTERVEGTPTVDKVQVVNGF